MFEYILSRSIPKSMYYYLPKKFAHSLIYYQFHGKKLNWKDPQTLDEKLHWIMTYCIGKHEAFFADKHAVRQYVTDCGFEELLIPEYDTWSCVEDINISALPDRFVLKTNHASGGAFYIICKDKETINWKKELANLNTAMHTNFAKLNMEYHYAYIKPLLMAEKLLEDHREERMIDYKINCFNGIPENIEVISNRSQNVMVNYFDLNWNELDYGVKGCTSDNRFTKPASLDIMIAAAKKLSSPFPYARIDFYDVEGHAYFGEITLTPGSGNLVRLNQKGQREMGNKLILPPKGSFIQNEEIFDYLEKNQQ